MKYYIATALTIALSTFLNALPCPASTLSGAQADQKLAAIESKLQSHAEPSDDDFNVLAEIIASQPQSARTHLVLGLCFEAKGLAKQALEQYGEATRLSPNDPKPIVDMITARIRVGETENISGLIAHAGKHFPGNADVMFLQGYDAQVNNKRDLAEKYLLGAYKLNAHIPWLKACLAEAALERGQDGAAMKLAQQELVMMPHNPKANMVVGLVLIDRRHFEQSVDYLAEACRSMPTRADLDEKLSVMSAWSGRYTAAIVPTLYYIALTSGAFSTDSKACDRLVECLRHSPRDKAKTYITEISEKFTPASTNPYFHTTVGHALSRVGWHEEARERYQKAIDLETKSNSPDGLPFFYLAQENELCAHDYGKALELYKQAEQLRLPPDISAAGYAERLEDRLAMRKQDLAWRLKDLLTRRPQ